MEREKANKVLDDTRDFLRTIKETKKKIEEDLLSIDIIPHDIAKKDKTINIEIDNFNRINVIPRVETLDGYSLQLKPSLNLLWYGGHMTNHETNHDFLNNNNLLDDNEKWHFSISRWDVKWIEEIKQIENDLNTAKEKFKEEKLLTLKKIKKLRKQKIDMYNTFFRREYQKLEENAKHFRFLFLNFEINFIEENKSFYDAKEVANEIKKKEQMLMSFLYDVPAEQIQGDKITLFFEFKVLSKCYKQYSPNSPPNSPNPFLALFLKLGDLTRLLKESLKKTETENQKIIEKFRLVHEYNETIEEIIRWFLEVNREKGWNVEQEFQNLLRQEEEHKDEDVQRSEKKEPIPIPVPPTKPKKGEGNTSKKPNITPPPSSKNNLIVPIIIIGVVGIILLVIVFFLFFRKKQQSN